jgi:hypothetical protein
VFFPSCPPHCALHRQATLELTNSAPIPAKCGQPFPPGFGDLPIAQHDPPHQPAADAIDAGGSSGTGLPATAAIVAHGGEQQRVGAAGPLVQLWRPQHEGHEDHHGGHLVPGGRARA